MLRICGQTVTRDRSRCGRVPVVVAVILVVVASVVVATVVVTDVVVVTAVVVVGAVVVAVIRVGVRVGIRVVVTAVVLADAGAVVVVDTDPPIWEVILLIKSLVGKISSKGQP